LAFGIRATPALEAKEMGRKVASFAISTSLSDMLLERTDYDEDFPSITMRRASVNVTAGICKPSVARFHGVHVFSSIAIAIAEKDTFLCPTGGATAAFW
jgi:hypothetical protein